MGGNVTVAGVTLVQIQGDGRRRLQVVWYDIATKDSKVRQFSFADTDEAYQRALAAALRHINDLLSSSTALLNS